MVKDGETYYYYFFDLTNTIHAFTKTMLGEYYNIDCMELMSRYPDKHFDLAIVDPPYGIEDEISKERLCFVHCR